MDRDHDGWHSHWTQLLSNQGAMFELTQPISALDECLPVRSRDGTAFTTRQDVLLPAFEEAFRRTAANHFDALTALLTAYVLLQPYIAIVQRGLKLLTPDSIPFLPDVKSIVTTAEARQTRDFERLCEVLRILLLDDDDAQTRRQLVSQSPLELLRIPTSINLVDLANRDRRQTAPAINLLEEATRRTLSLSEARTLLGTSTSAEDVQIDDMMKISEQNPRISFEMIKRCTDSDQITEILSHLGTHLSPNTPRSLDLFLRLSHEQFMRDTVMTISLPVYLSRCFDHIRSSERHGSNEDNSDPTDVPYEHIPRAIDHLIGFMDQIGILQKIESQDDAAQNLAIETKAFALEMVKYKVAHDLLKRLM